MVSFSFGFGIDLNLKIKAIVKTTHVINCTNITLI
jgi:hypothetical protein